MKPTKEQKEEIVVDVLDLTSTLALGFAVTNVPKQIIVLACKTMLFAIELHSKNPNMTSTETGEATKAFIEAEAEKINIFEPTRN